jgi:glycosyltransferase involved in cell wall biosynthesis
MSLRVLQIIPTLVRGGAEKQLSLLAVGLPRDRFDVHVAALTDDGPYRDVLQAAEVPVTLIGKRWKVDPGAYHRLCGVIRKLRPDIVHTWIFAANCYGRQAARAAGVRHILAGERCIDRWKTWRELVIDRYLARYSSRIVTNSTGVCEFYTSHGLPAEKFVVIPNGIRPVPSVPDTDAIGDRRELLAELGIDDNARLIGAIGRLWPQKRYKDLIWATELLKAIRDDVHLLIVGDGPQRERLERYAEQVTVQDRVHFLGERDDVPQVMAHLDCFWLGSGYEGQSNALMEAMSAGVPVVATDIAGNRDLVVPDKTGYLVPVGDAASFARHTNILLDDPRRSQEIAAAGRLRMQQEFSVEKMVARHAELYECL